MLSVTIQQISLFSYALAVNNVAIIRSVAIKNDTPNHYKDLKVKISFDPEFADTIEDIYEIVRGAEFIEVE